MSDNKELEERLSALENGGAEAGDKKSKPSAAAAAGGVAAIAVLGLIAYLALPTREEEQTLRTAEPAEFQNGGESWGAIEPAAAPPAPAPAPAPEPVVIVENTGDAEAQAALRAQLEALQAEIADLRNAPTGETDNAAAESLASLSEQMAALQAAADEAQARHAEDLAERDREVQRLRSELEIARLDQEFPMQTGFGQDPQLAELERRRAEAAAFEEARVRSPIVAFGGTAGGGGEGSELAQRTLDAASDFVFNGARVSEVTQAQVIANPANTVVQGTMIQAITETALDSTTPGMIRAIISEDVHSFDGTRTLIPRGSRLVGRYQSGLNVGQKRVTIGWDRIILPNNQTVTISSFGGDELGRSGVTGFVDTRFGARFGSAALISIIGAVPELAAAEANSGAASTVARDIGDDLQSSTSQTIGEYLSIGPVIHVDQGKRITVMVDRDVEIF